MLLVELGKDASSISTVNSFTAGLLPGDHSEKSLEHYPRKGQLLAAKVMREHDAARCLWAIKPAQPHGLLILFRSG